MNEVRELVSHCGSILGALGKIISGQNSRNRRVSTLPAMTEQ